MRNLLIFLIVATVATPGLAADDRAVAVEPGDLLKRTDLVGKDVVVDDLVGRWQWHRESGIDQIFLKRAPDVTFEIPARLRPKQAPSPPGVIVRGTLRRDGDRIYVEVLSFEPVPSDVDRLDRGVSILPKADIDRRNAWARWGLKRAREFDDDKLAQRATEVEREVIAIEADRPAGRDPVAHWLALADRARALGGDGPDAPALVHRALRLGLSLAKSAEDDDAIVAKVQAYLPDASRPTTDAGDLESWEKAYAHDPWGGYRSASSPARATLDHRLWADAVQKAIEDHAAANPSSSKLIALAGDAAERLPDRPKVAESLLERGLNTGSKEIAAMRQAEVDALAAIYRDRLKQPEKARSLYRSWLDDQRLRRLALRDADGRITLAQQYETLLDDRTTAITLLREASRIDPSSKEVYEAFVRRGYRQVKGEWVEGARQAETVAESPDEAGAKPDDAPVVATPTRGDSLRGATDQEVRSRFGGKPNRVIRSSTRGQIVEQWVYYGRQTQYINFVRKPGEPRARVVAYYSLPTDPGKAQPLR